MRPSCRHCMRGDPQQIDLSREDIDALIRQTEMIGNLYISGGEPTLNLDSISYLLERAKQEHVPIFRLQIITNGLAGVDGVAEVIGRWSEYLHECNFTYKKREESADNYVDFRISIDDYHNHEDFVRLQVERYKEAFEGIATVNISYTGQVPNYVGNAKKNLREVDCVAAKQTPEKHQRQIAILDKDHKPLCIRYKTYKMYYEQQVIVCCGLYLTAKGNVVPFEIGNDLDYGTADDEDNIICNVHEDVYESIFHFNENKMNCFDYMRFQKSSDDKDLDLKNMVYALTHPREMAKYLDLRKDYKYIGEPSAISDEAATMLDNPILIWSALDTMQDEIEKTDFMREAWKPGIDASAK